MNYPEDAFVMISALQHFCFCKRQCALIHIEQVWQENFMTAEGRVLHEKAHSGKNETRGNIRIARSLKINSPVLGVTGVTDVVEFHTQDNGEVIPFPIEYKRGKPKEGNCDRVQLCVQAMCLEYMLKTKVPFGALYYGKSQRREDIEFSEKLRNDTILLCSKVHDLIDSGITPPPIYNKRCQSCSLFEICMPNKINRNVEKYINKILKDNNE